MGERAARGAEQEPLYRKLRPGPGRSPEQVLANQCARLCGAMVQLVAEQGFDQVTVRGLSRLAGVSTKTFYKCFDNLEDCYVATYGRIVGDTLKEAAAVVAPEERLRARTQAVFASLERNWKAAHFVLVDAFAVGPAGIGMTRRTARTFGRLVGREFAAPPDSVVLHPLLGHAIVAAAVRVARQRLLVDPAVDVAEVADQLVDWILTLKDDRLSQLWDAGQLGGFSGGQPVRPRPPLGNDRQFLLSAVAKLTMADGYAALTVPAVRREAGVTRKSFDANFSGVEECFLVAAEAKMSRALHGALSEAGRAESWERGVVKMAGRLCRELAADPELMRLGFTEIFAPGRPGLELREQMVTRWAENMRLIGANGQGYGAVAAEASVAACWSMARAQALTGSAERIAGLAPAMAFVVLAPAIGAGEAEEAITAELRPLRGREVRRHQPQPS